MKDTDICNTKIAKCIFLPSEVSGAYSARMVINPPLPKNIPGPDIEFEFEEEYEEIPEND
jgi:hypothetical protein